MRTVVPKLITGMSESSVRIRNIVERLKNFARRDRENLEGEINLNEVIRGAVAILNHEIVKGCHNFRLDLEKNLPMVKGCAQQLEQVVLNLILNSLQALPDKSKEIRIATLVNRDTGTVEMRVTDEGVGMTPGVMSRLSEPFFSTKLDAGGLGLGLSISASIIRDHHGTLDFASEVGKGTTARITLPPADHALEGSPQVSMPTQFR
jgi:signal transduction histidine kinase